MIYFIGVVLVYWIYLLIFRAQFSPKEVYDQKGNLIYYKKSGIKGYWKKMEYNDQGQLIRFTDSSGCDVTYEVR